MSTLEPTALYHLYPLGCLGADQTGVDRRPQRTLRGLIDWLPHIESLGVDGLLLGPVFAALSHGYDTVDHRVIDERLGTADDLDALIVAAADQGIGVVLDGASAYASRGFHRLADPAEADDPWFLRDEHGDPVTWRVDSLITPDHAHEGYRAYVADTMSSWLDRGVAGFRLDSAWSVPDGFWRRVLARVRAAHPRAWFLGQVFTDDLAPVVNSTTVSAATEYALMHGVRQWLAGGPDDAVVSALRVHQHNSAGRTPPLTFLGNHDFARLADVLPPSALSSAFAMLLTLPGTPAIYYGDEVAIRSTWTSGGPDALLRPALTPEGLTGARGSIPPAVASVLSIPPAFASVLSIPPAVASVPLSTVRELGRLRRSNPWLRTAAVGGIGVHDGALSCTVTGAGGALHVHVNPTDRAIRIPEAAPVLAPEHPRPGEVAPRSWRIDGACEFSRRPATGPAP